MKFLKRLTYFTAVVFAISCILSAIYIFRPDITDKIKTFLYPEQKSAEMITGDGGLPEETANHPAESIEKEETGQEPEEYETDVEESPKNDAIGESVVSDYILPDQSEIVVPEHVSGRNGYQQIQEDREQIDDEAAEELQNQIDA